jgi:hypothetical protein
MTDAYATLRAHLAGLLARFEAADQRLQESIVTGERTEAEAAALEATGEYWEASREIADLLLLLLRHAMRHHRDVLHEFIVNLLRPQLNELADALYRLERNSRGSP